MTRDKAPELTGVYVSSGVSLFTGQGYCLIAAELGDGTRITGQLEPARVRELALGWLGAAEAAEHDAAVYGELVQGAGMTQKMAAAFLQMLRERRALPEGQTP